MWGWSCQTKSDGGAIAERRVNRAKPVTIPQRREAA
jgi:hypothetical protein